jgi:hypothetical protein
MPAWANSDTIMPALFKVAARSLGALWLLLGTLAGASAPHDYVRIQVLDAATGRGVPRVELRPVNKA